MSGRRKQSDSHRTRIMLDLVRQKYDAQSGMSRSWVACEEVADGTGWGCGRFADVLAFAIWPSLKHVMIGYEVKASRSDLKKELSDLSKHQAIAQFCDEWWLVAWDESVLVDGIPADWGILLTRESDGERELVTHRKAAKRAPVAWGRNFIASLVRNAYDQSPRAAYVASVANAAFRNGRVEGERTARSEAKDALRPLARALYGPSEYRWPLNALDAKTLVAATLERLEQGVLAGVDS